MKQTTLQPFRFIFILHKKYPWMAFMVILITMAGLVIGFGSCQSEGFKWVEFNDKYDSIVGITVDGVPVASGFLMTHRSVMTSATPVERVETDSSVKVHVIDGHPDKQKIISLYRLTRDQSFRNSRFWQPFGFDNLHSPIHDIAIICLAENITSFDNPGYREPFASARGSPQLEFVSTGIFRYAGFGFIDKDHVKSNWELEPVEYEVASVLEDCDEWIPRAWGYYICINNNEDFVGISSGAILYYEEASLKTADVVGIGSFSVTKGNESILVFTDIRKYLGVAWSWCPVKKPIK